MVLLIAAVVVQLHQLQFTIKLLILPKSKWLDMAGSMGTNLEFKQDHLTIPLVPTILISSLTSGMTFPLSTARTTHSR